MQLEEMTTVDVKEYLKKDTIVIIPTGSIEQHGPQNPVGTDFMLATYVARKACEKTGVICAPPIHVGISEHHSGFAGTLWFSPRLYVSVLLEVALRFAHHGFDHIVFLNGHGGNQGALNEVTSTLRYKHDLKAATANWYDLFDKERAAELFPNMSLNHAEAVETSANLAIHDHLVHLERVPDIKPANEWGIKIAGVSVPVYTHEFAPDGVVGTLDDISKESGQVILDSAIEGLVRFIEGFRNY